MPQEVIEVVEREVEVIEILERGLMGMTGPAGVSPNISYEVITSSQTVSNRQFIAANTAGGSFTLTLPTNPEAGYAVDIFDYSDTFDTNPLTIARNGQNIEGLADDLVANVEGAYFTLIFTGGTRGWQVVPRYGVSGLEDVLTTQGDLLYRGASAETRLGIGTSGQFLKVNSTATAPEWGTLPDSIDDYTVVTTSQTIANGARLAADTSGGSFTLTLPATPNNGDTFYILDFAKTFDTNNLTLARNGSLIEGVADDMVCNVEGSSFKMVYTGSTNGGWQMIPFFGVAGVASVSGTAPIVSSGGATPAISITAATTSAAGSLSAADKIKLNATSGTNTGDQTITLTGNVTGSGTGSFAATIANDAVDNTKLSNMAQSTLKGRATASTGDPEDLSASQVRTILNVADGAEVNVQSDWTESNNALDSFILNKPATFTPSSHTHGSITNDGKVGSTSGLPVVTTTAGAVTTLALGTANQVLRVNSGATGVEFGAGFDAASPPPIGSTTPNSGAFTTLAANNGTLNASAPVLDLAQTWNNSGVTFTGLRFNAAGTSAANSAAASLIADFQVGGTSQVWIDRAGNLAMTGGIRQTNISNPVLLGGSAFFNSAGLSVYGASVRTNRDAHIGWTPDTNHLTAPDLQLFRDAADTLAQRRGASAQEFRLYGQFTTTTNFERLSLKYNSTALAFQIGTEKGTSGSARPLEFQTDGATRWTLTSTGQLTGATGRGIYSHFQGGFYIWSSLPATGIARFYGDSGHTRISSSETSLCLEVPRLTFNGTTNLFPALKRSLTALQVRLANDSDFAPLECAGLTLNGNLTASTRNIVTDTTTGTKIGTATTQKIGFFDKTPVVQPTAVADATDAATVITQLNALLLRMRDLGLIAT